MQLGVLFALVLGFPPPHLDYEEKDILMVLPQQTRKDRGRERKEEERKE